MCFVFACFFSSLFLSFFSFIWPTHLVIFGDLGSVFISVFPRLCCLAPLPSACPPLARPVPGRMPVDQVSVCLCLLSVTGLAETNKHYTHPLRNHSCRAKMHEVFMLAYKGIGSLTPFPSPSNSKVCPLFSSAPFV